MDELLITTVDGPRGSADVYEVTLPSATGIIEVEYTVVFNTQRLAFPSLGEAHIAANELVGTEDEN